MAMTGPQHINKFNMLLMLMFMCQLEIKKIITSTKASCFY